MDSIALEGSRDGHESLPQIRHRDPLRIKNGSIETTPTSSPFGFEVVLSIPRDPHMQILTTGNEPLHSVGNPAPSTASLRVHDMEEPPKALSSIASGTGVQRLALSVSETAILLGVSEKSVRRLIDRGLIRPSRALRHLRIPRWEIDRFLRESVSQSWKG